jgi:hypothetical protein
LTVPGTAATPMLSMRTAPVAPALERMPARASCPGVVAWETSEIVPPLKATPPAGELRVDPWSMRVSPATCVKTVPEFMNPAATASLGLPTLNWP